jgi:hypothetical protein
LNPEMERRGVFCIIIRLNSNTDTIKLQWEICIQRNQNIYRFDWWRKCNGSTTQSSQLDSSNQIW